MTNFRKRMSDLVEYVQVAKYFLQFGVFEMLSAYCYATI